MRRVLTPWTQEYHRGRRSAYRQRKRAAQLTAVDATLATLA